MGEEYGTIDATGRDSACLTRGHTGRPPSTQLARTRETAPLSGQNRSVTVLVSERSAGSEHVQRANERPVLLVTRRNVQSAEAEEQGAVAVCGAASDQEGEEMNGA
ncbi:hypothetical protein ERJ75_000632700 [Trypanosoma vivax]|nr:hypothetical protein ERJ75_000632700 [Trypanosoma vivax]